MSNIQSHKHAGGTPCQSEGWATGLSMGNLFQISPDFSSAVMTSPQCTKHSFLRFLVPDPADGFSVCSATCGCLALQVDHPSSSSPSFPKDATSLFSGPKVFGTHATLAPTTFSHDPTSPALRTSLPEPLFSHQLAAQESQGSSSPPHQDPAAAARQTSHQAGQDGVKLQDLSMCLGSSWKEPG